MDDFSRDLGGGDTLLTTEVHSDSRKRVGSMPADTLMVQEKLRVN